MGYEKIDDKLGDQWAISMSGSVGYAVAGAGFQLANLQTRRTHSLTFVGTGLQTLFPTASTSYPTFKRFYTNLPLKFSDFNGKAASIASISLGIWGYTRLAIYNSRKPFLGPTLASINLKGLGISIPGASAYGGLITLHYGSGNPSGKLPKYRRGAMMMYVEAPPAKVEPLSSVKTEAIENPKITLPADLLFDFDSAKLKSKSKADLAKAVLTLYQQSKNGMNVLIEGHTDSKGSNDYNNDLSLRRAKAVKKWMVKNKVYNAKNFVTKGLGESEPIEPNELPNGVDNPNGRKANRRVTFQLPLNNKHD